MEDSIVRRWRVIGIMNIITVNKKKKGVRFVFFPAIFLLWEEYVQCQSSCHHRKYQILV